MHSVKKTSTRPTATTPVLLPRGGHNATPPAVIFMTNMHSNNLGCQSQDTAATASWGDGGAAWFDKEDPSKALEPRPRDGHRHWVRLSRRRELHGLDNGMAPWTFEPRVWGHQRRNILRGCSMRRDRRAWHIAA